MTNREIFAAIRHYAGRVDHIIGSRSDIGLVEGRYAIERMVKRMQELLDMQAEEPDVEEIG